MNSTYQEVLDYWFEDLDDNSLLNTGLPQFRRWFGKDGSTDREILERFEALHYRAAQGECDDWQESPRGRLALVLILDQFPRKHVP